MAQLLSRLACGVLVLATLVGAAAAQVPGPSEASRAAPADSAAHLAPEAPRSGWLYVLPAIAYTPETKLILGGSAGRYYRFSKDPLARPTTVTPLAVFTTNSQIMLGLFTDAWWSEDQWHLASDLGYSKFPTQFYGVGDDTPESAEEDYTPRTTNLELELTRRTLGDLYLGMLVDARHTSMADFEAGGRLESGAVLGAAGGTLMGLGLTASWDSRDAVFYPTRGWYNRLALTRYLDILGGDYTYTHTDASFSHYLGLGERVVLAGNLAGSFITGGEAPFYALSRLMLRGYFDERYLDNHVIRGQLELRSRVWGPLGVAVFGGVGEMAASLDRLRLDEARPAVGLGLRYSLGGEQPANIRLDYGWGDGDSGLYIRFGEAF